MIEGLELGYEIVVSNSSSISEKDSNVLVPPIERFNYPWIVRIPFEYRHNCVVEVAKAEEIVT